MLIQKCSSKTRLSFFFFFSSLCPFAYNTRKWELCQTAVIFLCQSWKKKLQGRIIICSSSFWYSFSEHLFLAAIRNRYPWADSSHTAELFSYSYQRGCPVGTAGWEYRHRHHRTASWNRQENVGKLCLVIFFYTAASGESLVFPCSCLLTSLQIQPSLTCSFAPGCWEEKLNFWNEFPSNCTNLSL